MIDTIDAKEREQVYRKACSVYGEDSQIVVAIEELSELQKELCKVLRGKINVDNLAEELADVEIMTEQMRIMFFGNSEIDSYESTIVDDYKAAKIDRLRCRIAKETNV